MTPITREERYLSAIAGEEDLPKDMMPNTREEQYLSAIAGETELPKGTVPITRIEKYLQKILDNGGGGGSNHTIEDAFIQSTPMDEYINDRVTTIGMTNRNDVFGSCQIKKVSLPNVTQCPASYAFNGRNVSTIEELYLPNLQSCGYGFAESNPNLRIIDFGKAFAGSKCRNCPNLEVLVVRDTSLKNVGSEWLTGCTKLLPDGSGGIVYVPQNLLAQYQASDAWQTYANVEFRAIEGSIYELE